MNLRFINSLQYSGNGILVNYVPQSQYSSCIIKVYNQSNVLVTSASVNCNGTSQLINNLDSCQRYKFVLISSNSTCTQIPSDTAYSNSSCCPKPVRTNVHYNTGQGMTVTYIPQTVYTTCTLKIYSQYNVLLQSATVNCSGSSYNFPNLDSCGKYRFFAAAGVPSIHSQAISNKP